MQRKYLDFYYYYYYFLFIYFFFLIYSYSLKKEKREGRCIQSSLKGCKQKRLFKGHHFLMESTRKRTPFQSRMVQTWVMGSFQWSDSTYSTMSSGVSMLLLICWFGKRRYFSKTDRRTRKIVPLYWITKILSMSTYSLLTFPSTVFFQFHFVIKDNLVNNGW